MTLRMIAALAASLVLTACPASPKTPTPKADAPVPPDAGPEVSLAVNHAQIARIRSMRAALSGALRAERDIAARRTAALKVRKPPASVSTQFTLLFSANNMGELEDCGCRRNPLGGLDRRATLMDWVTEPDKIKNDVYWGEGAQPPDVRFYADAGDFLFRMTSVGSRPPKVQDRARRQGQGVIEAMNALAPDAVNVGELDLAMGRETFATLTKKAKFPIISANLRDAAGEPMFPGHVVVERGGRKVAYVGLTKERATGLSYYRNKGVQVKPAMPAYLEEVGKLPKDIDLVVLLSNLGLPSTTKLVRKLREGKARVDVAVVSNSNRLTKSATWVEGVPVVEPLSRGKYFGRVDIFRVGTREQPLSFINEVPDLEKTLKEYGRAWRTMSESHLAMLRAENELLELRRKGGAMVSAKAETVRKRREKASKRAKLGASTVRELADGLKDASGEVASPGDDWWELRIVPVSLSIPQNKRLRKVLDRYLDKKK